MDNVRPLFRVNQHAPDAESQAKYLEQVAAELRAGTVVVHHAVIVYTDANGDIQYTPFGEPCNGVQLVGMLHYAMARITEPQD